MSDRSGSDVVDGAVGVQRGDALRLSLLPERADVVSQTSQFSAEVPGAVGVVDAVRAAAYPAPAPQRLHRGPLRPFRALTRLHLRMTRAAPR